LIIASTKRAVEASDNVVQAYALNMGLPELALPTAPMDIPFVALTEHDNNANMALPESPGKRGVKRQHDDMNESSKPLPSLKRFASNTPSEEHQCQTQAATPERQDIASDNTYSPSLLFSAKSGPEFVNAREVIDFVIKESLRASNSIQDTAPQYDGPTRRVHVRTTLRDGTESAKIVEWVVHPNIPKLILGMAILELSLLTF